jgi:putative transposase
MIDAAWRADLHAYIGGTIRGLGGVPLAVGGVADHVHALAGIKATQAVADLVREVKKASSNWASERYVRFGWQSGYGAFSVSPDRTEAVTAYIRDQEAHHRHVSSADELRAILEEYGIQFDERYFD